MNRNIALALGMVIIFAVTVAILLVVMPGPHKSTDYLVIGCVATLLCLLLLFLVLINSAKQPEHKPDPEADSRPSTDPRA
jgi:Na+/melibiose symporter-like transporter